MEAKLMVPQGAKRGVWAETNMRHMHPMQVYAYPKITSHRCSRCNNHYYDIEFFVPVANEKNKIGFALLHNARRGGPGGKLLFSGAFSESCITPGCRHSHPLVAVLQQHSTEKSFKRMMTEFHKGIRHMNTMWKRGILGGGK